MFCSRLYAVFYCATFNGSTMRVQYMLQYFSLFVCQFVCLYVCLFVCLSVTVRLSVWCTRVGLQCHNGYTHHQSFTGPLTRSNRLLTIVYRLSSSVTLHGGPAGGFTRAGQAMTSCRLQSNYSSTASCTAGQYCYVPLGRPCSTAVQPHHTGFLTRSVIEKSQRVTHWGQRGAGNRLFELFFLIRKQTADKMSIDVGSIWWQLFLSVQ